MTEIVLASGSPRRKDLLRQIGIVFQVMPSNVDETVVGNPDPEELVQELSYKKAMDVAERLRGTDSLIIGADTVVVKNGILGKPENEKQAFEMLKSLQNEWHEVVTGIALVHSTNGKSFKQYEKTRVKMRALTDSVIYSYIKTGEPLDKAGAYGIQGMGALLVESIEGCYFNVVGLPLSRLNLMLEDFGVRVL